MEPTEFGVSVQRSGRHALVSVSGEVDLATAPDVEKAIIECVDQGSVLVVVDMSATTFMSCAGINAVIAGRTHGRRHGAAVGIKNPSPAVGRLLRMAEVLPLLLDASPVTPVHPAPPGEARSPAGAR